MPEVTGQQAMVLILNLALSKVHTLSHHLKKINEHFQKHHTFFKIPEGVK